MLSLPYESSSNLSDNDATSSNDDLCSSNDSHVRELLALNKELDEQVEENLVSQKDVLSFLKEGGCINRTKTSAIKKELQMYLENFEDKFCVKVFFFLEHEEKYIKMALDDKNQAYVHDLFMLMLRKYLKHRNCYIQIINKLSSLILKENRVTAENENSSNSGENPVTSVDASTNDVSCTNDNHNALYNFRTRKLLHLIKQLDKYIAENLENLKDNLSYHEKGDFTDQARTLVVKEELELNLKKFEVKFKGKIGWYFFSQHEVQFMTSAAKEKNQTFHDLSISMLRRYLKHRYLYIYAINELSSIISKEFDDKIFTTLCLILVSFLAIFALSLWVFI